MLHTYISSSLAISVVQSPGTFMINEMHEASVGWIRRWGGRKEL